MCSLAFGGGGVEGRLGSTHRLGIPQLGRSVVSSLGPAKGPFGPRLWTLEGGWALGEVLPLWPLAPPAIGRGEERRVGSRPVGAGVQRCLAWC